MSRRRKMPVSIVPAADTPQSTRPGGAYTAQEYYRRDEHKARTNNDHEQSYILSLHTDEDHHKSMTSLREKYFPQELNKLEAHVALFRALPGSQLPRITQDIASLAAKQTPFSVKANEPFRMKCGVGIHVVDQSGQTKGIYEQLRDQWKSFLSQQDRSFRAHYTVQNKVDEEAVVQRTLDELGKGFHGSEGRVLGLSLWRYEKGFWRKERDFGFGEKGT